MQESAVTDLSALVSPYGVVSRTWPLAPKRGLARVHAFAASAGSGSPRNAGRFEPMGSCGRAVDDPERARLVAIAEGAERYSAGEFAGDDFLVASAADLDGLCVDVKTIPRCSPREYAHPKCPLRPFDPDAEIRWASGIDLADGAEVLVPAVMACYGLNEVRPSEKFWYMISTGYAVHSDPAEAIIGGIFEVVERDSIALTWLQKLALPTYRPEGESDLLSYLLDWSDRHFIRTWFFDATTDIGIPTVYCLQIAEHDRKASRIVGCATDRTMLRAAEKALLEVTELRPTFYQDKKIPETPEEFDRLEHGALYMGAPERAEAFDFLLTPDDRGRPASPLHLPSDPAAALRRIVTALDGAGIQVIAVDRTRPELASAGLTAVNVIIPRLQPMSLLYLAQYRGHPRLFEGPAAMGYPVRPEPELNEWPQPFA